MAVGAGRALADIEWDECLVPETEASPELVAEVKKHIGAVPGWVARVGPLPWLARANCSLMARTVAHVPPELADLIKLVVSQDNSCRYCYGVQRALLRIVGYSPARIAQLERDFHTTDLSRGEQAALDFARKLSRANPRVTAADREELARAGFTPAAIAEIAFLAAATTFSNREATLLALPPEPIESFVERPLFRLVRPLLARGMRRKPLAPEPLPEPNDGPFAAVVAALAGSPSARVLRRVIDDAWASPVLPRRTKTLMLAVIARALGCGVSEREARSDLERDGFPPADVDQVLATLGSPELDAREARLVPFARETVHYQPAAIQRRIRDVTRDLGSAEVLEVVGIVSLVNAVCRLSVLLDAC